MEKENFPYAPDSKEAMPLAHYRNEFAGKDPEEIARRCQVPYDAATRTFTLVLLGQTFRITHPDFTIEGPAATPQQQILFLRYLDEGAYTDHRKFITYRELPWGDVYVRQFTGRCITRMAFSWGSRIPVFCSVLESLGAKKCEQGDASYELEFMPGLFVRLILWAGDDEFPPNAQILLSDNFATAFATEDVAYVGDIILNQMKGLAASQNR